MSPPATNLNVRLGDAAVAQQKPQAKDRLGQDIEHGVRHNLTIDRCLAGAVGKAPDTKVNLLARIPNDYRVCP